MNFKAMRASGHFPVTRKILIVMKITTFLLLISIMTVSAASYAQKITLNERQASLEQIFDKIRQQSGYNIVYSEEVLSKAHQVTLNFKNADLEEVLKAILADQTLTYEIENKTIIIKEKQSTFIDKVKAVFAQITISGKVQDETGQPMVGVTVAQKTTNNANPTDNKGFYTLTVPDNNTIVTFSFVGFETVEVAAKDIPVGSIITLKAISTNLREVSVNKGYYREKSELSTGNTARLTSKEIEEQPVSDPLQALIGRIPGLVISQSSGIPGAYATVRVRGQNSIANGNDPLYIIDGVPFSSTTLSNTSIGAGALSQNGAFSASSPGIGMSPFNSISPADIENIEVLKDADATAIYGSRGANGVILITTKKGKAGSTKANIDISQGVGQVTRMMDLLNTQQYLLMRHEAFKNDGSIPGANDYDVNGAWDTTRYTNWQKVLIGNTAQYTNIQANISGGNTNTQFLIGAGYNHQTTIFPGDFGDGKGSVHVNLTHISSNQKFHLAFTTSYVNDRNTVPNVSIASSITLAPDAPALYNADGSLNWQIKNGAATFNNPLANNLKTDIAISNNLISSLNVGYKLLPGLDISSNFGYTYDRMDQTNIIPATAFAPPNNVNPTVRSNRSAFTTFNTWIIEPQITYKRNIARGTFDVLFGSTFQQNEQNSAYLGGTGFASDALIDNLSAATSPVAGTSLAALYHYNAIYGRIAYNWEEKYLLNITARRDGSSRFGPGKQFGNFGAIGAGWIFSKEKFTSDHLPFLSFGKLRVSYGVTGNDQTGDYQFLSTYTSSSSTYQGTAGLSPTLISNPSFGWEQVKKLEGGLELGFLKDRIFATVSYFRNRTENQLVGYPIPSISGFSSVPGYNLPAVLQNTGVEFTLNTINIKAKDFSWTSMANLSIPRNKLVSFPGLATNANYSGQFVIGQPVYVQYITHYTGLNPTTGLYTVMTANTNGSPSYPQDYYFSPPITQQFYGGFQNSISYKGFALDFFIQFVKQTGLNYLTAFTGAPGYFNSGLGNQPVGVLQRWQNPGDNASIQKFTSTFTTAAYTAYGLYKNSDARISDASFIRLQNLTFSYQIDSNWQRALRVQNAKVFMRAQNLFTITNYLGLDPETQGLSVPPLRMITFGISSSL